MIPKFRRIHKKLCTQFAFFFKRSAKNLRFLCEKCEMGHQKMHNSARVHFPSGHFPSGRFPSEVHISQVNCFLSKSEVEIFQLGHFPSKNLEMSLVIFHFLLGKCRLKCSFGKCTLAACIILELFNDFSWSARNAFWL